MTDERSIFNEKQIPKPPLFKTKLYELEEVDVIASPGLQALVRKGAPLDHTLYKRRAVNARAVADDLKTEAAEAVAKAKAADVEARAVEKAEKVEQVAAAKKATADGEGGEKQD